MNVTEEIKQRLDIVDLIGSSGVQLRKAGRNFTGFCPFHPNARTPAFYVFPHHKATIASRAIKLAMRSPM